MAYTSIVDYLNSQGKDSSFSARSSLASQYGITGYTGTAEQNTSLLSKLQGSAPSSGGSSTSNFQYFRIPEYQPSNEPLVGIGNVIGAGGISQSSFGGPGAVLNPNSSGFSYSPSVSIGSNGFAPSSPAYQPPANNYNNNNYGGGGSTPSSSTPSYSGGGSSYSWTPPVFNPKPYAIGQESAKASNMQRSSTPSTPFSLGGTSPFSGGSSSGFNSDYFTSSPYRSVGGGFMNSSFNFAGSIPTAEEIKQAKLDISEGAASNLGFGDFFRGLLGIRPANAASSPSPTASPDGRLIFYNKNGDQVLVSPQDAHLASSSGLSTTKPIGMTNQQEQWVSQFGPEFNKGYITATNSPITGPEFKDATSKNYSASQLKPTDTASQTQQKVQQRVSQTFQTNNAKNAVITQQLTLKAQQEAFSKAVQAVGGYVKIADPTTGQINVAKINPDGSMSHVTLDEFQANRLDINSIPDASQLGDIATKNMNQILSQQIDTKTGLPYVKEDFEVKDDTFKTELTKKSKDIEDFAAKYNLKNIPDKNALETKYANEEGLPSLNTQKRQLEDNIEAIIGEYDKLSDEIKNDPDFSNKLKGKRLTFLDTEKQRSLAGFQRQLKLVDERIGTAEKKVMSKISNDIDTYNAAFTVYKEMVNEKEKIQAQLEKETDNARQLFNSYIASFGGTAWNDLSQATRNAIEAEFKRMGAPHLVELLKSGLQTQKDKSLQLQAYNTQLKTPTGNTFVFNGETFSGLKKPTSRVTKDNIDYVLDTTSQARLRSAGIQDSLFTSITDWILQGKTLEQIREGLRATGQYSTSDGRPVLDVYDQIVNIAGLLAKQQFKSPDEMDWGSLSGLFQ